MWRHLQCQISRNRVYILGVRLDGDVTTLQPDEFFQKVGSTLNVLKTPPLPVEQVILGKHSAYLHSELKRRLEFRAQQDAKVAAGEAAKDTYLLTC